VDVVERVPGDRPGFLGPDFPATGLPDEDDGEVDDDWNFDDEMETRYCKDSANPANCC
jgi:hypothetical protein